MNTYRVTRRHVRGRSIVRELVAGGFENRESAEDYVETVLGQKVGDTSASVWWTVDKEREAAR